LLNISFLSLQTRVWMQDIFLLQDASSCLSTLVLLQGISSLELLKKLLNLRTQALKNVLQPEGHDSVKVRVCTSLKLLIHTVLLLHTCFLGEWIKIVLSGIGWNNFCLVNVKWQFDFIYCDHRLMQNSCLFPYKFVSDSQCGSQNMYLKSYLACSDFLLGCTAVLACVHIYAHICTCVCVCILLTPVINNNIDGGRICVDWECRICIIKF
jgi:hypothetical protein